MAQLRHTLIISRKDTNTAFPSRLTSAEGWENKYQQTLTYSDDQLKMTIVRDWNDHIDWKNAFAQVDNTVESETFVDELLSGLTLNRTLEII